MYRDSERQKVFGRRTAMLVGGKLVLLSALVGRMYYLQVLESERYATLADDNRINLRLLPPPRGRIVDRFGVPVAVNQHNYQVILTPGQAGDVEAILKALGAIIDIGENERRRIMREARRRRPFVPVTARQNLSWTQVAQIEVNAPDLPGVMIDVDRSRDYPHGEDVAHVLGYVAAVSEDEITGDPLLRLPGFRIGKAGVEKVHDRALRGTGGSSQVEVNALGRVIKEIERQESQPGAEVALTIDLALQKRLSASLRGQSAAAVVLDVHAGEVLAMASAPSFDPNAFNRGLSGDEWGALVSDSRSPLINKAIAGQFAPGSAFKPVVALAALEKGAIAPATRIFCSGSVELGDARFHCWEKGGHGDLALADAIIQSCDVYFYEAARRTGIDRIAAMGRRLGLGRTLGLDLPGEQGGLMPTRDWKQATIGVAWQPGETLIAGVGQSYILATPLQLAVMVARIVNGGREIVPRVTRGVDLAGKPAARRSEPAALGLPPAHLGIVRRGMKGAVNHPRGTAYKARIAEPGLEMGGKTGTVQVRRITKMERRAGIRKNEDLPWEARDHAVFVGYAPTDAPRYAVAVVIEHGGGGAKVAAPIARDILLAAQHRDAGRTGPAGKVTGRPPAVAGRSRDEG